MNHLVIAVFLLASACSCACLLNSPLTANETHPCPPCAEVNCTPIPDMHRICRNLTGDEGLVFDPCACCKTCARLEGQSCGGPFGVNGSCKLNVGVQCSVPLIEYLTNFTAPVGVCWHNVCFKNCSKLPTNHKCGNTGVWYDNICALRQANCHAASELEVKEKVREARSATVCQQACSALDPPVNGQVHYSHGTLHSSVATFTCKHGYELSHGSPASVTCSDRQWSSSTLPVCLPNPCLNTFCSRGRHCVLDAERNAECRCLEMADCPGVLQHVCGSDGRTYENLCLLQAHSCHSQRELQVQYDGECLNSDINSR